MLLRYIQIPSVIILAVLLSGCVISGSTSLSSSPPELSYCSSTQSYPQSITVTGTAVYQRREFIGTCATGGACYLGAAGADTPIRYAEVRVLSGSNVVQCGQTDNNGQFSITLPSNAGAHTLQVNSRAANEHVNVSVLDSPRSNSFYSLETSVTSASSNINVGTLRASATGDLKGGAFNIYDQILKANEYLRLKITTANGCNLPTCTAYTVAPKAKVYWSAGVNPGEYFDSSSPVSFYIPSQSSLYILGGVGGSTDNVDTDHFDNTVILHEYGHFLEAQFSKSDSPGGSHNGDSIIDPRLAWSEGFANYFGVLVNSHFVPGDYRYRDSYGNSSSATRGVIFNYNIETNSPSRDVANTMGEGNFREFAISRTLWDATDRAADGNHTDADTVDSVSFLSEFWTIFRGSFASSSEYFRAFGRFFELHTALAQTDVSSVYSTAGHQHRDSRLDYAAKDNGDGCVYTSSTAGAMSRDLTDSPGSFVYNQFQSVDFYHYSHPGGSVTLNLIRQTGTQDLDIYVYTNGYSFGGSYVAVDNTAGTGNEQISTSLSTGEYIIAIVSSAGLVASHYDLSISNTQVTNNKVCP